MAWLSVSYTLLASFDVPDDITPDEIEEIVENHASKEGFWDSVNDIEWDLNK